MHYTEYRPPAPLRHLIHCFWWMESGSSAGGSGPDWDRTLPDGCLELILHLADPMLRKGMDGSQERESRAILIGQTTRPYLFAATGRVRMLGVRFHAHAAGFWFGGDMAEFNDRSVDLELLLPPADRLPLAALEDAISPADAVGILRDYFLCRLERVEQGRQYEYLRHACTSILAGRGTTPISRVSRELAIGNRYLERLFVSRLGISPKFFARVVRFQGVFAALNGGASLARVAQDAGYFDQSHFVREFRALTGLTPGGFLRERHPMSRHFIEPSNCSYLYNSG